MAHAGLVAGTVTMLGKLSRLLSGRDGKAADLGEVRLGVFGKHPGWDDHIDDIGLDTEELIAAKRVLYADGIGRNIDSGAWDRLGAGEGLPGFDHVFLWIVGDSRLCGRIWASSDGKGRSRYPMVACAHWAAGRGLEAAGVVAVLEELKRACAASSDALGVRGASAEAKARLSALPSVPAAGRRADLSGFADSPEMIRVMYELGPALDEHFEGAGRQVRVPLAMGGGDAADGPAAAMERWGELLIRAGRRRPVLLIHPIGRRWLDAVIGPVSPGHLFCLLAGEGSRPLTTEIPFEIGAGDEAKARTAVRSATGGG